MSPETRMSISLRKRPRKNMYPGRSGMRFPSTAGMVPVLGDLAEVISPIFAFCSVPGDAERRHDISLPATHQLDHPPSRERSEVEIAISRNRHPARPSNSLYITSESSCPLIG